MNLHRIWLIIILMSTALLGIILVQAFWINNAISQKRQLFHQQVNEAMNNVVNRIETTQTASLLNEHFNLLDTGTFHFRKIDSLIAASHFTDDTIISEILDFQTREGDLSVRNRIQINVQGLNDPNAAAVAGQIPSLMWETFREAAAYNMGNPTDYQLIPMLLKDVEEQLLLNVDRFNHVMKQMLVELVQKDYMPSQRVDIPMLDTLLEQELAGKGIHARHDFGVVLQDDRILSETDEEKTLERLLESKHRVPLYPRQIIKKPDTLLLSFPSERRYVMASIWPMLTGSLLFTLIIIFCFSYTIYIIFRQKKLSDIKTDFINNMTHEFKTPLATISLAVDSINNPMVLENRDRIRQYSSIIRDENKRMNSQVEKVLQMALLDKRKVRLSNEMVDVHALIHTAVDNISLQVEQKGGEIQTELRAGDHIIQADEVHFSNLIYNLLDNANKYTPEKPVIKVRSWNQNNKLYIAISDNGIGMSRDQQKKIFEKFYRVPKGNLHDVKGFGLGLTYVKAILEAHNGQINVRSQIGRGSTFTIHFPLQN